MGADSCSLRRENRWKIQEQVQGPIGLMERDGESRVVQGHFNRNSPSNASAVHVYHMKYERMTRNILSITPAFTKTNLTI